MMSEWYRTESLECPQEYDKDSSPTTVYQRRNIQEEKRMDALTDKEYTTYVYEERTMTKEEYAAYQAELESPAIKMIMQTLSSVEMRQATIEEMMEV